MKTILTITLFVATLVIHAKTITVTNTDNSGAGSLRQALADASNGDVIEFDVTGVITVTSTLDISKNLDIKGPGAHLLAIDGGKSKQIFRDNSTGLNTIIISGLEIRNGSHSAYGGAINGRGIHLTIKECNIHSNKLRAGYGAAISINGEESSLTIENSTIHNNTCSGYAAGIYTQDGPDVTITNSTFYNNRGPHTGQALYIQGGNITLTNVTIAGHDTGRSAMELSDYNDFMDESKNEAVNISMVNCIFDNKIDNYDFYSREGGEERSFGYNLSNDKTMRHFLVNEGDINRTSAVLDTAGLQDNGGNLPTLALLCGSPAIDAGILKEAKDQIGADRYGNAPDMGALESNLLPRVTSEDTITACNKYKWVDGNTYYSDTIVSFTFVKGVTTGCDSVVTLNLTINKVNTDLSIDGLLLSSNAIEAEYQWLDCDDNFAAIEGENEQTMEVSANGSYAVSVTQGECVDTSSCEAIFTVGTWGEQMSITISPNPTTGIVSLDFGHSAKHLSRIRILSLSGQILEEMYTSSTQVQFELDQPKGIYFIEIVNDMERRILRKLVKM